MISIEYYFKIIKKILKNFLDQKRKKTLAFLLPISILYACGGGNNQITTLESTPSKLLTVVTVKNEGLYQTTSNTTYISENSNGLINFILPTKPEIGDQISIIGNSGADWTVQPNSEQRIRLESIGGAVGKGDIIFGPIEELFLGDIYNSIVSSFDGDILLISSSKGIYKSIDYGQNWTLNSTPLNNYGSIAASVDGQYIAVISYQNDGNHLLISSDYGASWNKSTLVNQSIISIAISGDGSHIFVTNNNSEIYTSIDGGMNWVMKTSPNVLYSIATNTDGSRLVAGTQNNIYISTDYGSTWKVSLSANSNVNNVAASSDGRYLLSYSKNYYQYNWGDIYISIDFGEKWQKLKIPFNDNTSIAISRDGNRLALTSSSSGVAISDDHGVTWISTGASKNIGWFDVIMNHDGSRIALMANNFINNSLYINLNKNYGGVIGGAKDALTLIYLGQGVWSVLNKSGNDFSNY